ncbi:hypothetical protein BDZ97DRAFT_1018589 [Flammula alnicola]|nr:hypothetical protein BDZ97DRAFT_1018589 [Flammula alnicola]
MLQLDNFFAWITVDDREQAEYGVEYSDDLLHASCWIASEEGKNFVIHWRDTVRPNDSIGRTLVDGVRCGVSQGISRRGYRTDPRDERDTAHQGGVPTSSTNDKLFVFSKLDLTDDDVYLNKPVSEKLGEITLEVSYVQKGDREKLRLEPFQTKTKVHERTIKLAQHHTRLGESVKGERKPTHAVKSTGKPRVFSFKYRPLEILKAKGLAPQGRKEGAQSNSEVIDLTLDSDEESGYLAPRAPSDNEDEEDELLVKNELLCATAEIGSPMSEERQISEAENFATSSRTKIEAHAKVKLEDRVKAEEKSFGTTLPSETRIQHHAQT